VAALEGVGAGMTATTTWRGELFAALDAHPALAAGRVHLRRPRTLATPAVWVGSIDAALVVTDAFRETELVATVVVVVDGDDHAAGQALDDLGDAVWDACWAAGTPQSRSTDTVDVGGPTLPAVFITVAHTLASPTLCPIGELTHV
jgi:hypothetical protein